MFDDFPTYGSWEAGDSLKPSPSGVGTISTVENSIMRAYMFSICLFSDFDKYGT